MEWLEDKKKDMIARKTVSLSHPTNSKDLTTIQHAASVVTFLEGYRSSQTMNGRRADFAATVESRMLM